MMNDEFSDALFDTDFIVKFLLFLAVVYDDILHESLRILRIAQIYFIENQSRVNRKIHHLSFIIKLQPVFVNQIHQSRHCTCA
jgi:hypothetical protein